MGKVVVWFAKGHWGKILPAILRGVAEGKFGEPAKKIYWASAGYKTVTGAVLIFIGGGLEVLAGTGPEYQWAVRAGQVVYTLGGILASVGLADGGTRSPWPEGTPAADRSPKWDDIRG